MDRVAETYRTVSALPYLDASAVGTEPATSSELPFELALPPVQLGRVVETLHIFTTIGVNNGQLVARAPICGAGFAPDELTAALEEKHHKPRARTRPQPWMCPPTAQLCNARRQRGRRPDYTVLICFRHLRRRWVEGKDRAGVRMTTASCRSTRRSRESSDTARTWETRRPEGSVLAQPWSLRLRPSARFGPIDVHPRRAMHGTTIAATVLTDPDPNRTTHVHLAFVEERRRQRVRGGT